MTDNNKLKEKLQYRIAKFADAKRKLWFENYIIVKIINIFTFFRFCDNSYIMRYSQDGRKRVLDFIADGNSKAETSRRFQVSRRCIYNWLDAADPFTYEKPGPRKPYRLDPEALAEHVIPNYPKS